jgi:uncharacterized protein involved in response to NO
MELTQIISTHSLLVKLFLGFVFVGIAIPILLKQKPEGFKKASFIYTMVFQAIITAILATGIYALIENGFEFTISTIVMIVVWALMMFLEIKRHKAIKSLNENDLTRSNELKNAFIKTSVIQILLIASMVVLMILKAKGVIAV